MENVIGESVFDSDLSADEDESDGNKSGNVDSDSDDSDGLEVWDGVLIEEIVRDIFVVILLFEFEKRKSKLEKVNVLVFWLVYFFFIW